MNKIYTLGKCIKLEADIESTEQEDPKPVWVQIARAGDYPGYISGDKPFELTEVHFQQMIDNIHNHPSFVAGEDGVGIENIIPWDYNHASEMFPGAGNLPVEGAPSQAWTRDLKMAKDKDGKTCLMAYTLFLEPALSYIRNDQYQWSSIAARFDAIHPETGENIGAIITSIALTNTPFIEGMEKLAASKNIDLRRYYSRAEDINEAIHSLKSLFGLMETVTIDDVMMEIMKLSNWIENGDTPMGVDLVGIIGSIREILGLPTLSTEKEVIDNALSIPSRLVDEMAVTSGIPAIAGTEPLDQISDLVETAAMAKRNEADMELIKVLASKLGSRESDDAVVAAVEELIALRSGITDTLNINKDTNESIMSSVAEFVTASGNLSNILKALGANDEVAATEKIVTLTEHSNEYTKIKPEFDKLMEQVQIQEDQKIEAEVTDVMSSRNFPDDLKEALLLYRKNNPEGFAKKYPKIENTNDQSNRHSLLTAVIASAPDGKEKKIDKAVGSPTENKNVIDLRNCEGVNITDRAKNYILANIPESKNWSYDKLIIEACELKKQENVVDFSN
jgi:hypothetical protein